MNINKLSLRGPGARKPEKQKQEIIPDDNLVWDYFAFI